MLTVASTGIILFLFRGCILYPENTIYFLAYSETTFRQARAGMTTKEVEALMGPPLRKVPWFDGPFTNWQYTTQYNPTLNFWRRWVFIRNGKVAFVVNDYGVD